MLGALLLNLPARGKLPKNGIRDGCFIMVAGTLIDARDEPSPEAIKKVGRAIRSIKLPKKEKKQAERLLLTFRKTKRQRDAEHTFICAKTDVLAYHKLLELLRKRMETDEELVAKMLDKFINNIISPIT